MQCVNRLPYYMGFTASTPALPQLYFDVQTNEQRWKEICVWLKKLTEFSDSEAGVTDKNSQDIEVLEKLLNDVRNGLYADLYLDAIRNYVDNDLVQLVARTAKYVFPELYFDGETWRHSVVIPQSWDWLRFVYDWSEEDSTVHLTLNY